MKDRLSRLDRIYSDAPIYFLTCCSAERQPILAHEAVHQAFRTFCEIAVTRQVLAGRYVIMPDHLHFFVFVPDPVDLSTWVKSLKNTLSRTLRDFAPSPHWQKGYFDYVLRSDDSYEEKWAYVRMNPVRAGLVADPEKWPFQGEITPLRFD
jgi:putative transposase